MFAWRDACIHFGKETWSHLRCFYLYKMFTRHLNMECFESAVPAIFLSYAPNFTNKMQAMTLYIQGLM